eukprot:1073474-Rhodomonas_salina.1
MLLNYPPTSVLRAVRDWAHSFAISLRECYALPGIELGFCATPGEGAPVGGSEGYARSLPGT